MLEAYLIQGIAPIYAWIVFIGFLMLGFAWGVSRALGFYASFCLCGWPNASDCRPFTHGLASLLLIPVSTTACAGSMAGFYLVYFTCEIFGDRVPFFKRFVDYCSALSADQYKEKGEGYRDIPGWLMFIV